MNKIINYIDEAIKLEINAAELYFLFSDYLKEYKDFWYNLSKEEFAHAALLKLAKEFEEVEILPKDTFKNMNIKNLVYLNSLFIGFKEEFIKTPTIEKAKELSLKIEGSAAEEHYQNIMTNDSDNRIIGILQRLNRDDKNHLERIMNL